MADINTERLARLMAAFEHGEVFRSDNPFDVDDPLEFGTSKAAAMCAAFARLARASVDAIVAVDPSLASNAGLVDDAVRVPHLGPDAVATQVRRIEGLQAALRELPWRRLDPAVQIDVRLLHAALENARRQLAVEKLYVRRPGAWLEPTANNLLALATYAPGRPELQDAVLAQVPGMVAEARAVVTTPTRRDVATARGLVVALSAFAEARHATAALAVLRDYDAALATLTPAKDFDIVGAAAYDGRLRDVLLLPWTGAELRARAEAELALVDPRVATLSPWVRPETTAEVREAASALTRDSMLALYDTIEAQNRAATEAGGWVTVPAAVGPVRARETPDALLPLTGDGGSMNPPPTFVDETIGWWNVQHFDPTASLDARVGIVGDALAYRDNGTGPYAAHEGFPGHHLQLAIARLNPDPLRSILPDPVLNEGWALYAETVFWENGGLGTTPAAELSVLRSYRHRIRRVVYDTNIEAGTWDLQAAADYKYATEPGKAPIDEELMRSINWPAQLICYYAGRTQLVELRDAYRAKMGAAYDPRAFHDAVLAEGSIPVALIRAAVLGEPVPGFDRK